MEEIAKSECPAVLLANCLKCMRTDKKQGKENTKREIQDHKIVTDEKLKRKRAEGTCPNCGGKIVALVNQQGGQSKEPKIKKEKKQKKAPSDSESSSSAAKSPKKKQKKQKTENAEEVIITLATDDTSSNGEFIPPLPPGTECETSSEAPKQVRKKFIKKKKAEAADFASSIL